MLWLQLLVLIFILFVSDTDFLELRTICNVDKIYAEAKLYGLDDLTVYLMGAWRVSAACWH